jgi:hypothetical protein
MNTEIEKLDRRRMRYLEWHLIGLVPFIILTITRYFFRLGGLNGQPIGYAVLGLLLLSLVAVAASSLGFAGLGNRIKQDPVLKEALYNELVQSIEVRSWKAAYLGTIATTLLFAAAWFFYPVNDPVMVALTSIIVGAGAYHTYFYFEYRSS